MKKVDDIKMVIDGEELTFDFKKIHPFIKENTKKTKFGNFGIFTPIKTITKNKNT